MNFRLYFLLKATRVKHKPFYGLSFCMSTPMVLGVYGSSNAGKTTLIVRLVKHLKKEGYKIATIKRTKKSISLDTKGKDTWRHYSAGSNLVVFSSACETDFLVNTSMSTSEILRMISDFGSYDLVLVEGADDPAISKIQIGSGSERKNTIAHYEDNFNEILNVIKHYIKMRPSLQHLHVKVNGKDILLTEFPEQIITNTIIGLLTSLKGVQNVNEVTIQLTR